jgi:uncharacterized protein
LVLDLGEAGSNAGLFDFATGTPPGALVCSARALQLQCPKFDRCRPAATCGVSRMSRLLFLLAVVIVVYLLLRSMRAQAPKRDATASSEEMVRCAQCGVHVPRSESILAGGNFYCSDAHRREHTSK